MRNIAYQPYESSTDSCNSRGFPSHVFLTDFALIDQGAMIGREALVAPDLPFPIFQISKHVPRYLLFDIKTVTWLRRAHKILGVLIGSLPQSPQQNVFLGLPLELQPEEVKLLIDQDLAFVVDDLDSHRKAQQVPPKGLKDYRLDVQREGLAAAKSVERQKRQRTQEALQRLNIRQSNPDRSDITETPRDSEAADHEDSLFDRPQSRASQVSSSNLMPYTSTPTTSYPPITPPSYETAALNPDVNAASFALFKHIHKQGYFLSPGLRFGCQFMVYPGDPLRFHSHFLAVSTAWDEEIDLLDVVGGGRLGTGVKKAWMIGGPEEKTYSEGKHDSKLHGPDGEKNGMDKDPGVRTFCIEWAGM